MPDSDFSQADYELIDLARDLVPDAEDVYALEVRGTSMIDALIGDGDIVLMRHQTNARNGETVAAWIKDEKATTLKTLYWEQNARWLALQPANPTRSRSNVHAATSRFRERHRVIVGSTPSGRSVARRAGRSGIALGLASSYLVVREPQSLPALAIHHLKVKAYLPDGCDQLQRP